MGAFSRRGRFSGIRWLKTSGTIEVIFCITDDAREMARQNEILVIAPRVSIPEYCAVAAVLFVYFLLLLPYWPPKSAVM
jgi:hypothetical protein